MAPACSRTVSDSRIAALAAWEALDSRGNPAVACEVTLRSGHRGEAIAPSGASTGTHESWELRDGGERYGGRGVRRAVAHVENEIEAAVVGVDAANQRELDRTLCELDGTPDLRRLGGNAILAVSCAAAVAAARAHGVPLYRWIAGGDDPLLPMPMVNVLSGGRHASGAVDMQDFLVVPVGASSFAEALEWAWRVRTATCEAAAARGLAASLVADEGGLGVPLASNRAALELLAEGIERSRLTAGDDAAIAIDVAATQLAVGNGVYALETERRECRRDELLDELSVWAADHPVVSLEDPLAEDDWEGWQAATSRLGSRLQILGDDLFATNLSRVERGIAEGVANGVIVKPNQAGTLAAAKAVLERAREAGYATVVSARSGETEEAWLADLAVGWRAGQIKVGSTMRSERTAKWNRLLRIEAELGESAEFAGRHALAGASSSGA